MRIPDQARTLKRNGAPWWPKPTRQLALTRRANAMLTSHEAWAADVQDGRSRIPVCRGANFLARGAPNAAATVAARPSACRLDMVDIPLLLRPNVSRRGDGNDLMKWETEGTRSLFPGSDRNFSSGDRCWLSAGTFLTQMGNGARRCMERLSASDLVEPLLTLLPNERPPARLVGNSARPQAAATCYREGGIRGSDHRVDVRRRAKLTHTDLGAVLPKLNH